MADSFYPFINIKIYMVCKYVSLPVDGAKLIWACRTHEIISIYVYRN